MPVIVGLPAGTSEDRLKALGRGRRVIGRGRDVPRGGDHARGADAGGCARRQRVRSARSSSRVERLRAARDELTTVEGGPIAAVSVGTPHLSVAEIDALAALVRRHPPMVPFYANTGRDVLAQVGRGRRSEPRPA